MRISPNQKLPEFNWVRSNISKALRGKALQSQSWLKTDQVTPRKKFFSLSDSWRSYWEQIFKEASPKLDS